MTSPIEDITVQCPKCEHLYKDWFRASVNLDLDPFDSEHRHTFERGILCKRSKEKKGNRPDRQGSSLIPSAEFGEEAVCLPGVVA